MLNKNKIAVISTGNGGQTMAAYFANLGYTVSLYAREQDRVEMFPEDHIFRLSGVVEAEVVVDVITSDMQKAIQDAHLIMVTTPNQYHPVVAKEMAKCLEDGQMIVLNPGRTFGTFVFKNELEANGMDRDVVIAEAETFVFACRCSRVAEPHIHGMKSCVQVAAHNPAQTGQVVDALLRAFPGIIEPAESTLHTSFTNVGMVFHPLPILLNITRVEAQERFYYYIQGISPLVANIIERLDRERLAVARAYGVEVPSVFEWMGDHYNAPGETLYERIQNNAAYQNILAPVDIDTRYIYEDMLTGCVPMYYAGQAIGVETPVINSAILWASTIYQTDFKRSGRNDEVINFDEVKQLAARLRGGPSASAAKPGPKEVGENA